MLYLSNNTEQQRVYIPRNDVDVSAFTPSTGGTSEKYYAGTNIEITPTNVINVTGLTEAVDGAIEDALTGYTPTNGFATINGSAITEGGNIVIEGGGSDENAQHRWTAATETDMEALTGVSEGDVCVLPPHSKDMPDQFNEYLSWGWDLFSALLNTYNGNYPALQLTLVNNPYCEQDPPAERNDDASLYFYKEVDGVYVYNGYGYNFYEGTGWYKIVNGESEFDRTPLSLGESFICDLTTGDINTSGGGDANNLLIQPNNLYYADGIEIKEYVLTYTSYQFNDGEWIKLATKEMVASAMSEAQQAVNIASSKLAGGDLNIGDDEWSSLTWWQTGIYHITANNDVDYGYRFHYAGADTEEQHPQIDKVVSSDNVIKIWAGTMADYNAMASHSQTTLYFIIDSNQ